jgi:hypothetical protein
MPRTHLRHWLAPLIAAALPCASASAAPLALICQGDAFGAATHRLVIDPDHHVFDGHAADLTQPLGDDGVTMKTCRADFLASKAAWGMVTRCEGMADVGGEWINALTSERWSLDRATGRLTYAWRGPAAAIDRAATCTAVAQ